MLPYAILLHLTFQSILLTYSPYHSLSLILFFIFDFHAYFLSMDPYPVCFENTEKQDIRICFELRLGTMHC